MPKNIAAFLSLVVPGLGQATLGRFRDALLFLWAGFWLHMLQVGIVRALVRAPHDAVDAFLFGGLAASGGLGKPALVMVLVLCVSVHVWSLIDARRVPKDEGRGLHPAPVSSSAQPSDTAAF